jgi:hypothetical protein
MVGLPASGPPAVRSDVAAIPPRFHNVEFMIWRRHAQHAGNPLKKEAYSLQAESMFEFERRACREVAHVVACGEVDNKLMREQFGITTVSDVPTA